MPRAEHPETPFEPPRAPNQAAWDAMTDAERARIVESLPMSMTEYEAAPPEGDHHFDAKVGARDVLRGYYSRLGRRVYVGSELTTYYPDAPRFAPDLLVVFDVDPHPRTRWVVSEEGKCLDFVLEVHYGGDRRKDAERNVELYARVGISEYFIFDRRRLRLVGYRLSSDRTYIPIMPQAGRWASEILELDLTITARNSGSSPRTRT